MLDHLDHQIKIGLSNHRIIDLNRNNKITSMQYQSDQLDYMIETDSPRVYDAYDQAVLQGIKTDNQRHDDLVNVSERVVEVENGEEAANLQSLIAEAEDLQSSQQ